MRFTLFPPPTKAQLKILNIIQNKREATMTQGLWGTQGTTLGEVPGFSLCLISPKRSFGETNNLEMLIDTNTDKKPPHTQETAKRTEKGHPRNTEIFKAIIALLQSNTTQ